ncbi:unnamed protein product [Linum tenue]|uniref:Uncharacterized protein n=1 Tax=Linum tenue TaxID=586396 RepID=A0AAV0J9Q5_9ROSI|nr:unnamed protein product [Linum tenue]
MVRCLGGCTGYPSAVGQACLPSRQGIPFLYACSAL